MATCRPKNRNDADDDERGLVPGNPGIGETTGPPDVRRPHRPLFAHAHDHVGDVRGLFIRLICATILFTDCCWDAPSEWQGQKLSCGLGL